MRIFNTRCRRFRSEDPVWQELGDRPACAATFTALFYLNNLRSFVSVRYLNHLGFASNMSCNWTLSASRFLFWAQFPDFNDYHMENGYRITSQFIWCALALQ
jgi:hypothetical protein